MARMLGRRTAQLHAALALRTGDPDFDPEPVTAVDIDVWTDHVRADVVATVEMLQSRLDAVPENLHEAAAAVAQARTDLLERVDAWAAHPAAGVKTRYHGSYHLEQVMLVENDYVIVDLEGEQGVSAADARRKHSALRDVASMLRSFDYARRAAVAQATQHEGDMERMAPAAEAWLASEREEFLRAYRQEALAAGLYPDEESFDAELPLLEMFELERALYELRYELEYRPDWVGLPLRVLAGLLAEPEADQEEPDSGEGATAPGA